MLVFVDITGRRPHRFDPRSGRHEIDTVEEDIGCVAPAKGARLFGWVALGDLAVGCGRLCLLKVSSRSNSPRIKNIPVDLPWSDSAPKRGI